MNRYFAQTKNFQVELKNDLLLVRTAKGECIKAVVVPAWNAVEKFTEMVKRVKALEAKGK